MRQRHLIGNKIDESMRQDFMIVANQLRLEITESLAAFVEKQTGIRHESPQILALRNGEVSPKLPTARITITLLKTLYP